MDAAHDNRRQLGQLMVDEGFITLDQLTQALAVQNTSGLPLGKVLVDLGFVSEGAVANALAEQHGGLLKTEFGISAGLHAVEGGATRQAVAAAADPAAARIGELEPQLQAVLRERNALTKTLDELQARQGEPAPDPAAAARLSELESELETVLTERSTLTQKLNELQARKAEQVPDPAAEARVAELESQLSELEAQLAEPASDPAAAARVAELETHLHEVLAERNDFAEKLNELQARLSAVAEAHEAEIAHVTDSAAARIDELEAELQAAVAARSELETAVAQSCEPAEPPQQADAPEEATSGRAHLLFVPASSGYALIDFEGPDPPSGTLLDVDGVSYIVRSVGASPFPGDRLRCVYLDPV